MPLLIKDIDYILTMDEKALLKNKSMVIEDGKIVEIGETQKLMKNWVIDEVIDGRGSVALPGLIDLHNHSTQSVLRGVCDGRGLMDWLNLTSKLYEKFDEEICFIGSKISFLEKIKNGITLTVDMESFPEQVIKAAVETGIRLLLTVVLTDTVEVPGQKIEGVDKQIKNFQVVYNKWHKNREGRVMLGLAPCGFPSSSPELMAKSAEIAAEKNLILHSHVAENKLNVHLCKRKFGKTEVELMEDIGYLDKNLLLAHGVYLTETDVSTLAKYGVSIVHCPSSNLKLANGVAPLNLFLKENVKIGLGTDGAASNNGQDLFFEMKLTSLLQKGILKNPSFLPPFQVLKSVTIDAARILGLEKEIGSLSEGKRADLILVNLKKPWFTPKKEIISHLVYSASGRDVSTVIINGEVVVKDGEFLKFSEEPFLARANSKIENFLLLNKVN